jgi:primosomal protein N'
MAKDKGKEKGKVKEAAIRRGDKYHCPHCQAEVPVRQDCPVCKAEIYWTRI